MTLTGAITEMKWTNPHALSIDVKDERRSSQLGDRVCKSEFLYRRGWRQTDLPPRSTVTVTGYSSRDSSRTISSTDVKRPTAARCLRALPRTANSRPNSCGSFGPAKIRRMGPLDAVVGRSFGPVGE